MPTDPTDFRNKFDSDASASPSSDADTPRAWWFAKPHPSDGHYREFVRFDETLRHLRQILEEQGPFDGVFGFSQGAACGAILTALVEDPSLDPVFSAPPANPDVEWPPKPFKFAILSAGFFPLDPRAAGYFEKRKPTTPTLHVLGRGDTIVGEERSVPLTQAFEGARVEWHDGGASPETLSLPLYRPCWATHVQSEPWLTARLAGHHTPSKQSWRRFFQSYIEAFSATGGGADAANALPSPTAAGGSGGESGTATPVEGGGKL